MAKAKTVNVNKDVVIQALTDVQSSVVVEVDEVEKLDTVEETITESPVEEVKETAVVEDSGNEAGDVNADAFVADEEVEKPFEDLVARPSKVDMNMFLNWQRQNRHLSPDVIMETFNNTVKS